jgi:hypothetical protein
MTAAYYTFIGSLPALPYFEKAVNLPISRLKLEQRLKMLDPEDYEALLRAENLAAWQLSLAKPRTDAALIARFDEELATCRQPALKYFLEYRLGVQSLLAAVRRQQEGLPPPDSIAGWGVGPATTTLRMHWNEPDFRLGRVYPWLPEARKFLQEKDAEGVERLMLGVVWQELGRMMEAEPFGFGAVVAYLFRWDILRFWLARDAVAAKLRFQELIKEVLDGH